MAEKTLTKQEFSKLCLTPYDTIYRDIKRNNLVVDENGDINPNHPVNHAYKARRITKANSKTQQTAFEWNEEKKKIEAEKAKEDLLTARIKRQKLEGELLPKQLVQNIIATHFKNVQRTYYGAAEQIITDISKIHGIKREDLGKFKEMLVKSINQAQSDAKEATKEDIRQLVEEYAEGK